MVAAALAGIFGKGHVQVPVLLIFNTPMPTYIPRQRGGTRPGQRREKIARGLLHLPCHPAGGLLTDQRLQARPVRARIHQSSLLTDPDLAQLAAPMVFVSPLVGRRLG